MSDQKSAAAAAAPGPEAPTPPKPPKPPIRNPALRMLGLPGLPRKLPSRNWMIFWTVTTSISAAIIYDRREKRRATARWSRAVAHLAKEPLPGGSATALPRKLTIYLASPPGDGLRVAQDHFAEYVKPVLAASGLDWEFVQGRREGDVRAVVAERLRRVRRGWENDLGGETAAAETPGQLPTDEEIVEATRRKNGTPEYEGVLGDIVVGRHTWKEYVRGLHEGWLGPLSLPPETEPASPPETEGAKTEGEQKEEEKPKGPPTQPRPYNTVNDYPASPLPLLIPAELAPSSPIPFPHILGFLNTPTRMRRFFNRRALADSIGREVASVCLCTYREYRELTESEAPATSGVDVRYEQQLVLQHEERDWVKSVWKEPVPKAPSTSEDGSSTRSAAGGDEQMNERIWGRPVVLDPRIATRMRRFELLPEDETRARAIVVPEEEIEGWTKGKLRGLYRWGVRKFTKEEKKPVPLEDDVD